MTVAAPGSEIWVADGTYAENVAVKDGVALYGGFLGAEPGGYETQLGQRDWVAHVATIDGKHTGSCVSIGPDSRIDGFTITNGSGPGDSGGCGIYCNAGTPVIANDTITGNSAVYGGGVSCAPGSAPLIESSTLTHNTAGRGGGAVCCTSSSPTIRFSAMNDNIAGDHGGAIYANASQLVVTDCEMADNSVTYNGGAIVCVASTPMIVGNTFRGGNAYAGGAIGYYDGTTGLIAGNTIVSNTSAIGGGIHCERSSPVIADNVIANNGAIDPGGRGGGIACYSGSSPVLVNNTIYGNTAGYRGGGISLYDGCSPVVYDNIVAMNTAGDGGGICLQEGGAPVLVCNDVWGNVTQDYWGLAPGASDISADPLLEDPEHGDYRLQVGSPCIDAGDNDAPELPTTDIEGDPRIVDGDRDGVATVDIGADEFVPRSILVTSPPGWLNPGWNYFSIPLDPVEDVDATTLLGFNCTNILYRWDPVGKTINLYPDDFQNLERGRGYLFWLTTDRNPSYTGKIPSGDFEIPIPEEGWTWIGQPFDHPTLLAACSIRNNATGEVRTAQQDYVAADAWINWNVPYWNSYLDSWRILSIGPADDNMLRPWYGYHLWARHRDLTLIVPED